MSKSTKPQAKPHARAPQIATGLRGAHNTGVRAGVDANTKDGREPYELPGMSDVAVPALNPRHLTMPSPSKGRTEWHFRAKGLAHRVMIGNEPDEPLGGGRYKPGRTVSAQFKEGRYSTKDPHIAQVLFSNKNCGLGLDYWDAEEEDHEVAKAQLSGFEQALEAQPGLLKVFLEKVQAGSFDHVLAEAERLEAEADARDEADGIEGETIISHGDAEDRELSRENGVNVESRANPEAGE